MDIKTAIKERRSIRKYKDIQIEEDIRTALDELAKECNEESGLNIQIIYDDPDCFNSFLAHYGKFKNAVNYLALVGNKSDEKLDELCGYYGEKIVLEAQGMGLNTCWVAMTYKKGKVVPQIGDGEKMYIVIALGYGKTQGQSHKMKSIAAVSDQTEESPEWYRRGIRAALLAPTAVNQQKFRFTRNGDKVSVRAGLGFYTKIDLGIVKYNFEAAAGKENFSWE